MSFVNLAEEELREIERTILERLAALHKKLMKKKDNKLSNSANLTKN
tara:strand:+ start:167 stop:307 length:141 start_codon:yes stop_codon:yes gene_type:complete